MKLSKNDKNSILTACYKLSRHLKYEIKIYLYGSQHNGTATSKSDIDLAIEFINIENEFGIWMDIGECLQYFFSSQTGLNIHLEPLFENNDIVNKTISHELLYPIG